LKPLAAGSEIDAWCTRCKLDLGHRIVAMVAGAPKRVVCLTCGSHHNYRAPQSALKAPAKALRRSSAPEPSRRSERLSSAARAEQERIQNWQTRVQGRPPDAFTPYQMQRAFTAGELVQHPKFGQGYVQNLLEGGKIDIVFRDGVRTLAHDKT
jgi:hypothetical protein